MSRAENVFIELPLHSGALEKRPETGTMSDLDKSLPLFDAEILGTPFWGFVDYVEVQENAVIVLDHKTVKSPAFALSEEALRYDLQMMTYAYFLVHHFNKPGAIIGHNILTKNDRWKVMKTRSYVRKSEIDHYFKSIVEPMVASMLEQKEKYVPGHFRKVDNNADKGCYKFGKCHFYETCHVQHSLLKRRQREKGQTTMVGRGFWRSLRPRNLSIEKQCASVRGSQRSRKPGDC